MVALRRGGRQTASERGGSLVETLLGNLMVVPLMSQDGLGGPSSRDEADKLLGGSVSFHLRIFKPKSSSI